MTKNSILLILALGMMSCGFYNDAFAANITAQTTENQLERTDLNRSIAYDLIWDMQKNNTSELSIPGMYTHIQSYAFSDMYYYTSLIIPDSVIEIGKCAFSHGAYMNSVTIGKNVKVIGDEAFTMCFQLDNVIIPDNVTEIGSKAFRGCQNLTKLTIGEKVSYIGEEAFYGCWFLEEVRVYSEEIKNLLIASNSEINEDIIVVIEKPKDVADDLSIL